MGKLRKQNNKRHKMKKKYLSEGKRDGDDVYDVRLYSSK